MVSVASGVRYFIIVIFGFVHFSFFQLFFYNLYSLCISSAHFCCILYFFLDFKHIEEIVCILGILPYLNLFKLSFHIYTCFRFMSLDGSFFGRIGL